MREFSAPTAKPLFDQAVDQFPHSQVAGSPVGEAKMSFVVLTDDSRVIARTTTLNPTTSQMVRRGSQPKSFPGVERVARAGRRVAVGAVIGCLSRWGGRREARAGARESS